jgi:hypothetical protein
MHACMHTYIDTYIHAYIHTYYHHRGIIPPPIPWGGEGGWEHGTRGHIYIHTGTADVSCLEGPFHVLKSKWHPSFFEALV